MNQLQSEAVHRPWSTKEQLLFCGFGFTAYEQVSIWHVQDMGNPIWFPETQKSRFYHIEGRRFAKQLAVQCEFEPPVSSLLQFGVHSNRIRDRGFKSS